MNLFAIFGIESVLGMAIAGAILGLIFGGILQITRARRANQTKSGLDDLQKRIGELPGNFTKEQLDEALKNWEVGKK